VVDRAEERDAVTMWWHALAGATAVARVVRSSCLTTGACLQPIRSCLLAAFLAVAAMPLPAVAQGGDDVLQKVVIVSRHGVRTPMVHAAELANWSSAPWPAWTEPPGNLTARGGQLITQLGRYYRQYLGVNSLMNAAGCPAPGSVYVYADVTERTRATAQALLAGFAPDCGISYRTRGDVAVDALFHPLAAGVCKLDPMVAQTRVLERAGGDLNGITRDLKVPFASLQTALDCCKPALCTALGNGATCKLADLPTMLSPRADGSGLALVGALSIASSAAEILLLEHAEGKPASEVGWGRLTPAQMQQTFRLHTEQFDLMQRTPYLARRQGSALLSRVAQAVTSSRQLGFGVPDAAVRDAKFVAYVGHDTNIANLAGMLDMGWLQAGYQRNQTPPGGALVFEVREGADKKLRVYATYLAQSLEQMRNLTPLTLEIPPVRTALRIPGCSASTPGFPCLLEEFAVSARNALERECVE
jgi:4-phytase/acid phosphatase